MGLLQISDPHFGTEVPHVVEALAALTAELEPSLVVMSGDITQRATEEQFRLANEFLRRLPAPASLVVPGNHDGYASIGHAPAVMRGIDWARRISLENLVKAQPGAWPDLSWDAYEAWLEKTADDDQLGGYPRDIFVGSFERRVGSTFAASFQEVPRSQRNFILYDGHHQWRRTFGPLNHSWRFGKNHFVGIDSYNIDDTRTRARPVHSKLLEAGIPICEHMTGLGRLPDGGFRFFAVPPKIRGMGSFPVRAYAVLA